MKAKIVFIFVLAILIPTFLLAYFGLLAVRNEKSIVEKNMRQKYKAMADIVASQIQIALKEASDDESQTDWHQLELLVIEQASLFKDEVFIFDQKGKALGMKKGKGPSLKKAVLAVPLEKFPFVIGVYERYPLIFDVLEEKRQGLSLYVSLIFFSAISILGGGIYTLWALSREWRFAKLKSEFVSHLSHDLRRPLTSIRMFSEMLRENHIPDGRKKQDYYNIISHESDKLTHLADNILDFSRIERGRIRYDLQNQDIVKVIADTVDRFKTYMVDKSRPIKFKVLNPSSKTINTMDSPIFCKIDANAISQAVMNLLTNADKYSPVDKEIKVIIIKEEKSIIVDVIDQGLGIPESEQKKIFGKFYRVSKKSIIQVEGSGLGLTLIKYAVEAHGGKVKVTSHEGKGSKFSLVLPA
jgi:signal transduction histidine kinase